MKEEILIVEDEYIVADHLKRFLEKAGHKVCGIVSSYSEAISFIELQTPSWVLLDICLNGERSGIDLAQRLSELDIPFIYLSANMNQKTLEDVKKTKPYGFMSKPFKDKELMIMLDIAMDRHARILEAKHIETHSKLEQAQDHAVEASGLETKLLQFADALYSHINFDMVCLSAERNEKLLTEDLYILRSSAERYQIITASEMARIFNISSHEYNNMRKVYLKDQKPMVSLDMDFKRKRMDWPLLKHLSTQYKLDSYLFYPFAAREFLPSLNLFSCDPHGFEEDNLTEIEALREMLQQTLREILSEELEEVDRPRPVKAKAVTPTVEESYSKAFSGIIGNSPSLIMVLDQLKIVAPTTTSVLIMGESGTGKERIAQAVHELSPRNGKPFIIVNCAALPTNLIESELFGHEKGAFTGAGERRIGKFEQADEGTIFLDEIGELPMESQVKLLRVLQEKEIERVGGNQRKKVDVRIIAATNRNMEKEVAEGRFRLDLYYRLNVFPLDLPALRERRNDIPELVNYFVEKYATSIGKQIKSVSGIAMNQLVGYSWPGNIRELSHTLERSVLLAKDGVINEVSLPKIKGENSLEHENDHYVKSFDENERDHILHVLKKCFGRVAGEGGAAELLRVPPTTLTSKIKRLGILRKHISPE